MAQTARTVQVPELAAARPEPMEVTCRTQRPGLDWGRGRSQEPRPTGKVTSTHCVVSLCENRKHLEPRGQSQCERQFLWSRRLPYIPLIRTMSDQYDYGWLVKSELMQKWQKHYELDNCNFSGKQMLLSLQYPEQALKRLQGLSWME